MMKRLLTVVLLALLLFGMGSLMLLPVSHVNAQNTATWIGLFFNSINFSGASVQGTFTGLNQSWPSSPTDGTGAAIAVGPDNWSARLSSSANFTAGLYEFVVTADDGVRLLIDGSVIVDSLSSTGTNTFSRIVNLAAGSHVLVVEFVDLTGAAVLQVNWFTSTGTPQANGTAGATAVPAVVANVAYVRGLSVRSGPFLGASMVAVARQSVAYPVLARNTQEGLFTWYLIQYDADTTGWVSGRYLTFTGDPLQISLRNSTAFDTVYDPPGRVVGLTRSNMNFRVYPTERAARVAAMPQLPWGASVEILARTVQGGRNHWFQVRYTPPNSTTSYVGWIYAPYVGIAPNSDPLDTVPIL